MDSSHSDLLCSAILLEEQNVINVYVMLSEGLVSLFFSRDLLEGVDLHSHPILKIGSISQVK